MNHLRILLLFLTLPTFTALAEKSAMENMEANFNHFKDAGGEIAKLNMIQKNRKGLVLRENDLTAVTRSIGDVYETLIWVKNDGTLFFSRQTISPDAPESESWMYVPPIPGVKNSGKVFKVNQNTLQQSFIGSGFDNVDLEQLNIYNGERYSVDEESGGIEAESERYGKRQIQLDENSNVQEIRYFQRDRNTKHAVWSDYKDHRAGHITMDRLKRGEMVHRTEIDAVYQRNINVPDAVFNRSDLQGVRQSVEDLEEKAFP